MQMRFQDMKDRILHALKRACTLPLFAKRSGGETDAWGDSPQWQLAEEIGKAVAAALANARVDVRSRDIIWGDGKRCSLSASAQRLQAMYPQYPVAYLEEDLLAWLEGYVVPGATEKSQARFDRLMLIWIEDYERGGSNLQKAENRHS